jgi:transaldolase
LVDVDWKGVTMEERKLRELSKIGQSIWLDYISRSLIDSGQLKQLVERGVTGMTSNPAIFEKAIREGADYDADIRRLAAENLSPQEIFEALAFEDVQRAADILFPIYEGASGGDGFVSYEVSPEYSHDTQGTIAEVRRLTKSIARENVMIKVPATREGFPVIEQMIAEGRNINVTLMFSLEQYEQASQAYLKGLETRWEAGQDLGGVASVTSFFVSRVDVKVDQALDAMDDPRAADLRGKIGIANAKMAYQRFKDLLATDRWERLARAGAQVQRVLWASTSTKDPAYADTLYVDNLIGPLTVNTVPEKTFEAFVDHGSAEPTLERDLDQARAQLEQLGALGIDLKRATEELLAEGVEKFARPYHKLMNSIQEKCGAPESQA